MRDHPRVCGKYTVWQRRAPSDTGSPPRMREIHSLITPQWSAERITPAYAGNTQPPALPRRLLQDHPRVCGKYTLSDSLTACGPGSPPRMREILLLFALLLYYSGITPAYAGNTSRKFCVLCNNKDHPRVCGKYLSLCLRMG